MIYFYIKKKEEEEPMPVGGIPILINNSPA